MSHESTAHLIPDSVRKGTPDGGTSADKSRDIDPLITSRFARTFLAVFSGSLLLVDVINFVGNGNDLFPSPFRPALADSAWKARRLEALVREGQVPSVLIIGSSRVMQMNPDYVEAITGERTFNLAVSAGNLLDSLALFRFAIRAGVRPRLIVMNVDEAMLAGGVKFQNLRLAGYWRLLKGVPFPETAEILVDIAKGISQSSTISSLKSFALTLRGKSSSQGAQTLIHRQGNFAFLPNGYRINPQRARARQQGEFDLESEIRLDLQDASTASSRRNFETDSSPRPAFSPRMIGHLQTLLSEAKAFGIEVKILTTPEHPRMAGTPLGAYRDHLHNELVVLLLKECERFGFTYRDFANLASFGGDPGEFWDSTHQTPRNMTKMTNALFDLEPDCMIASIPTDTELLDRYGL